MLPVLIVLAGALHPAVYPYPVNPAIVTENLSAKYANINAFPFRGMAVRPPP